MAYREIAYRGWRLAVDPDSTRQVYRHMRAGGADSCSCMTCLNWVAGRRRFFPREAIRFFEGIGVDYRKEVEVYDLGRMQPGLHFYGGWFHFIGAIHAKSHGPIRITSWFSISKFSRARDLADERFGSRPLVQIDFAATVPWLLGSDLEPED